MKYLATCLTLALVGPTVFADGVETNMPLTADERLFVELMAKLPRDGERAKTVRHDVSLWLQALTREHWRTTVRLRDGEVADVVMLAGSIVHRSEHYFALALLVTGDGIHEWESCWCSPTLCSVKPVIEDVDGDGFGDVAFRAGNGEPREPEQDDLHKMSDDRRWRAAFTIRSGKFVPLFPHSDAATTLRWVRKSDPSAVRIEVEGFPTTVVQHQCCRGRLTLTNDSAHTLALNPDGWFRCDIRDRDCRLAGFGAIWTAKSLLKPGKSVSANIDIQLRCFCDCGNSGDIVLDFGFVPAKP